MAIELKFEDNKTERNLIPETRELRDAIRELVERYLNSIRISPPLSLKQMEEMSDKVIEANSINRGFGNFVTILISNFIWKESFSRIPYNRRILILPQCLRSIDKCKAQIDEFGLLCELCGSCSIGHILEIAENLGYLTLVAEGSTIVTKLIEKDQVDGIIGVSCISALEKSFPYTASTAVPAIALPLVTDGCASTSFDVEWIDEYLNCLSDIPPDEEVKPGIIKEETEKLFKRDKISTYIEKRGTFTEKIACDWLIEGGKRWRPFLYISICKALQPDIDISSIEAIAIAIESFHKASLIHDDIEDDDSHRYGIPTMHNRYGIPVALNAGDLLLGEGYRLIAESKFSKEIKADMLHEASVNHRNLCLGQGDELELMHKGGSFSVEQVLDIFRNKTSPAFQVALVLGAIGCNESPDIINILKKFSRYLGIAYQIKDDIEDSLSEEDNDIEAHRPSLIRAMWNDRQKQQSSIQDLDPQDFEKDAWAMFDKYKDLALDAIAPLQKRRLKSLLYKIVYKVLNKEQNGGVSHSAKSV